ncbi:MAG: galactokinase family protein [Gemmatimonadales bacterium]
MREYVVPGRVELVGKHVDYAGGRSLTCAIEAAIHARVTPLAEPELRVRDSARREGVAVLLSPSARQHGAGWTTYVVAVARRIARDFPRARTGVEIELRSDLPASAGLSSSSALVVALAGALVDANDLEGYATWRAAVPDSVARAEYFGAIETGASFGPFAGDDGVGVRGGAQDHVAIVCAEAGMTGQFHYLPARLERRVPWPDDHALVIGVSGVHATKTGNARSAYNRLSDALLPLAQGRTIEAPGPETAERLAQFREETDVIVPGVADALRDRQFGALGALVDRSQALAERVLGNQVPETVFLARSARDSGAIAATAFGAGFGGAVWAMVPRTDAATFTGLWRAAYERQFPARRAHAKWLVTRPSGPARVTAS